MIIRDSQNAMLPLVRFDTDSRPFLKFGESTGKGHFARLFSQGVEVFSLLTTGVLALVGIKLTGLGAGVLHSDAFGTITSTCVDLANDTCATALPIAKGGTGATTQQAGMNALAGPQSNGKYLRSDGTNTTLSTIVAGDVPVLNQNTTGTASNVTGTVAIANGGTGATTQSAALASLGAMGTWMTTPTNSSSAGSPGQLAFDSNFLYVCIASNTWKRVGISTF